MGLGFILDRKGLRGAWVPLVWTLWLGSGLEWGSAQELEPSPPQVEAAARGFAPPGPGYHDAGAVRALLSQWVESGGDHVRWKDSFGEALAIEFGAGDLLARPLESRRTVVWVGGLDGRSVAGGEAILREGHGLLSKWDHLREDLTFLLLPYASVEGLACADGGQIRGGRDLDGDGWVLQMLLEDPEGPWTPSVDARFLCRARDGDAPRYVRRVEGASAETLLDSQDLEREFPVLSSQGTGSGAEPFASDPSPVIRGLREYILAQPCALVVSFQGNHGGLAFPGASATPPWTTLPDGELFQNLGHAFRKATGRDQAPVASLIEMRKGEERGSFVDWCYAVPGVLALEVSPWGVGLRGEEGSSVVREVQREAWDFRPALDGDGQRWAHWLDEQRGGAGFAPWRPVVAPDGSTCLVGGWKPKTFWNPPEEELAHCLDELDGFVAQLVERLPQLELCEVSVLREGELCTVRASLRGLGPIPLQPRTFGRWAGARGSSSAWLRVSPPKTMRMIAGPGVERFPWLPPSGTSAEVRWLFFAPEGARLELEFGLGDTVLGRKELVL